MTNSTEALHLPVSKYKSASDASQYISILTRFLLCGHPEKRLRQHNLCVGFYFFVKTHVSGWIAILFNFVPANGRSLQMQSRHSFCASPLWLFVVGSRSWGETRTRAIETQKDEKSKNGHLFYYNKGVYFWSLDTRCTGEAPNVRC